jgi:type I restriction enzyme S subunit
MNPFYLHYALRLPATLEQFRKWSTGSSYPAILDDDVAKTLIPVPSADEQDSIARRLMGAFAERSNAIRIADFAWHHALNEILAGLSGVEGQATAAQEPQQDVPHTIAAIRETLRALPALSVDRNGLNSSQITFEELGLSSR